MFRKKLMWALISLAIAGLSIWAVASQSARFSPAAFMQFIAQSDKIWLAGALLCMFGFIWFEGRAVVRIAGALGYRRSGVRGTVYGAADVYFSGITPSASGGQPASAYFMIRDGIPGTVTTVTLLTNMIMYTEALLTLGLAAVIFRPDIVAGMGRLSHLLILIGVAVLIALTFTFYLLLHRASLLYGICDRMIEFLAGIRLLRNAGQKRAKLDATLADYRVCSKEISDRPLMLLEALFWNILQRVAQFGTAFCVFMAKGTGIEKAFDVFVTQCFVSLGSNCVPIPGSMGVADYLMLDGYRNIVGSTDAANMELFCRGMSFYGYTFLSFLIAGAAFLLQNTAAKKGGTCVNRV